MMLSVGALAVVISPNLPGPLNATPTSSSPGAYIKNFYSYALFLSGLLAFGAIVYGGIKYAISRGNPSGETEAKAWIWSALLGMLLLAGAYLILFTVNPNLVNLALPSLPAPAATAPQSITGQQGAIVCQGTTNGPCSNPSQVCQGNGGSPQQFSCQAVSSFTCGDPALGALGTCMGNRSCVRTDSGQPGTTPTYGCHS